MRLIKITISSLILLVSAQAFAGLGVGALGSYQQDTWTASGPNLLSAKAAKGTTRMGALLWIPIFPTLTIRTGYLIETQELETAYSSTTVIVENKLTNSVIPVNLQFDLPLVGLYIFGGALMVTNDSVTPSTSTKSESDLRINTGIGYEFISLAVVSINGELEYQQGTKNISPSPGFDLKVNALAANLIFRVGF